jgi:putative ABC transport system ATP-binding protein
MLREKSTRKIAHSFCVVCFIPIGSSRAVSTGDDVSVANDASTAPLFTFEHVSVSGLDGRWRLRDVNGSIPAQGVTALVGPSGSGKSTLLRCCNRLEVPAEGVVRFRGDDLAGLDVLSLRRRIAMVFQRPTPFPGTCRDNLRVADPTLDDRGARELLERVQLEPDFLDRSATELSGGEAQRLCLARSLAVGPEAVLMDEVTSSLDPGARRALEGLARSLASNGIPVVWVTHDLAQARRLAATTLVIVDGRIADSTEAEQFMKEETHGE